MTQGVCPTAPEPGRKLPEACQLWENAGNESPSRSTSQRWRQQLLPCHMRPLLRVTLSQRLHTCAHPIKCGRALDKILVAHASFSNANSQKPHKAALSLNTERNPSITCLQRNLAARGSLHAFTTVAQLRLAHDTLGSAPRGRPVVSTRAKPVGCQQPAAAAGPQCFKDELHSFSRMLGTPKSMVCG